MDIRHIALGDARDLRDRMRARLTQARAAMLPAADLLTAIAPEQPMADADRTALIRLAAAGRTTVHLVLQHQMPPTLGETRGEYALKLRAAAGAGADLPAHIDAEPAPCGARRIGWGDGPSKNRLPCILDTGHPGGHTDATRAVWPRGEGEA